MRTGLVSVSPSPLFEKLPPPPEGRKSGRLKVPTGPGGAHCRHVTDNSRNKTSDKSR